jgi:hypothetical protein
MIRMPDALEANTQKAADLGAWRIIPTVDDALKARRRICALPSTGRRNGGGQNTPPGTLPDELSRHGDNMPVVMI